MVLEVRPAHDPRKSWGFVCVVISVADLSASIWLWYRDGESWQAKKVITIPAEPADASELPPALQPFGAVPPLVTDIDLSVDDRWLYVSCWGTGEIKQYDVSDPHNPKQTGSVRLGGIVGRSPHPAAAGQPLGGAPQMVEISRDGRRVYFTNSLYATWDDIFYPDGVGAWMARIDANTETGGMTIDPGACRSRLRQRWDDHVAEEREAAVEIRMRPVLGRERLAEEIAGRRIERVVEAHEAGVAREDTAVGELQHLRKPLVSGDEGDRAVTVVDRANAHELVGDKEQHGLARRRGREDLVKAELILEGAIRKHLDVVHTVDHARTVDPADVVRERVAERAVKPVDQWRRASARRHKGQEECRDEAAQRKQPAHARTPFSPAGPDRSTTCNPSQDKREIGRTCRRTEQVMTPAAVDPRALPQTRIAPGDTASPR
jgi:56kDa selenium binding protein (SBP56)